MIFTPKNRSIIYTILVSLLVATYPLSLAANSITIGLIITFFILDSKENLKSKIKQALKHKFVWLSILYTITQFVGLLYSENLKFGLKQANHALPFLILPIIACSEKVNKKHFFALKEFIKYWTASIMLFFILYHLFIVKSTMNTIVDFTINEISSTSQLYPSALLLIAIVIATNQIINNQKRFINLFFIFFFTYCLLLLSSRIAILTFIITFTYILFTINTKVSFVKKALMIIGSLFILSISVYNVPRIKQKIEVFYKTIDFDMKVILTKNSMTNTKNTVEHRVLVYHAAAKAILKKLPFGYGTGDYQVVLNKGYEDINFKAGKEHKFNTHNQFLEEFLKTGVLGGIIFLLLIMELIRLCNKNDYLVLSMVILVLLSCLLDSFLSRYHGVIFMAFFIPLFFYNNKNLKELN